MKFALIILALLFSVKSHAIGVCNDVNTVKSMWDTKYSSYVQLSTATFSATSPAFKIAQAFCLLENPGIQNFVNFFGYIFKFVKITSLNMSVTSSYAHADTSNHELILYEPFFEDTAGDLGPEGMKYKRASTLIHEARHIEMKENGWSNYQHVVCENGDSKGTANCDEQFTIDWATASPYSYEVMYFKSLRERSTLNLNRKYLEVWINHLLDNAFNYVSPELYKAYSYPRRH